MFILLQVKFCFFIRFSYYFFAKSFHPSEIDADFSENRFNTTHNCITNPFKKFYNSIAEADCNCAERKIINQPAEHFPHNGIKTNFAAIRNKDKTEDEQRANRKIKNVHKKHKSL